MTNKTLCYYGTRLHDELIDRGLRSEVHHSRDIKFRFMDRDVEKYCERVSHLKQSRQEFATLNRHMYDLINMYARLTNTQKLSRESSHGKFVN